MLFRSRALDLGLAREQTIHPDDLLSCTGALLINSLGCRSISHLGEQPLPLAQDPVTKDAAAIAQRFWRQLLQDEAVLETAFNP